MDVIPVIDLKNGQVVHARGGQRHEYRPIETRLSPTSAPADVTAGLLHLAAFRHLYIADLGAIEGGAPATAAISEIAAAASGLELWVDNGVSEAAAARFWLSHGPHCLVIGSESQTGTQTIEVLRHEKRAILSLDFRGDQFLGPAALHDDPALWPARVIVMTLARVGAGAGPDLARISAIVARAGARSVYAAGGVRHAADLIALAQIGAAGALVATALHDGAVTPADLARP
jgi:phosphoribosylformimino-5-aminoimidazole carboxamide ribotide isomerase